MDEVVIRAAVSADATVLARLRYQFRSTLEPAAEPEAAFLGRCAAWMADRLARPGSWLCWVAVEADVVIGMVWLLPLEKIPNPVAESERHGYISSLYVRPECQAGGVGSHLLDACLRHCRAEQYDAVILWPTPRSRSLYARFGFEVREELLERRPV